MNVKKPFSVAAYDLVCSIGKGMSFLYNEAAGANALERNGAQTYGFDDFDSSDDAGIASRHIGLWAAAGIAAVSLLAGPSAVGLGIAAAVYSTMTVVPTVYRVGHFKKADYLRAVQAEKQRVEQAKPAEIEASTVVQNAGAGTGTAFASAPKIRP